MDGATTAGTAGGGGHKIIGSRIEEHQQQRPESSCCPNCGHKIGRKLLDWVGLPAGVKFDPTDQELIEHLEAKVRPDAAAAPSHLLIDEFIPTIEGEDGICYTHPEKLPGVTKDGLSRHFFHRPSKAYTTGTRKRRKIQAPAATASGAGAASPTAGSSSAEPSSAAQTKQQQWSETRWHKTGKTRPVVAAGGRQRGCKKILVLYTNFGKNRKPEKTNWVMHQYHIGEAEEEREGELVVSKIFFQTQPRQSSAGDASTSAAGAATAVERRGRAVAAAEAAAMSMTSSSVIAAALHGGAGSGIDEFSFAQFTSSFQEVGMGASDHQQAAQAMVPDHEGAAAAHHHLRRQHHHHGHGDHGEHDHRRLHYAGGQEQHHRAATAAFHVVSTPTDPIATLIAAPPRGVHQGSAVLIRQAQPYGHGAASFHHDDQEDERPHQPRNFDGRSTSGLEEVIMGCTSRRSKGGETSGGKDGTEWQYPSFWSSDSQDHHG